MPRGLKTYWMLPCRKPSARQPRTKKFAKKSSPQWSKWVYPPAPTARYPRSVDRTLTQNERLLLIDTCGETAGIALTSGEEILASEDLARGSASAEIIDAIRRLLQTQPGGQLRDLDAIGVVHGPGSFTGIRTGLAAAKGLCEAAGLP